MMERVTLTEQRFKKQTISDLKGYLKDPERYYNEKNAMNERFLALEQETNNYKKKAEEVQKSIFTLI